MQRHLQVLARFRQSRHEEFGLLRIGVFGSTVRDETTDRSDVDIVVDLSDPDLFALVDIKQELEELLQRRVDIVRYGDRMNAFLKECIEQEAVCV
jgi:hypothetical protein